MTNSVISCCDNCESANVCKFKDDFVKLSKKVLSTFKETNLPATQVGCLYYKPYINNYLTNMAQVNGGNLR